MTSTAEKIFWLLSFLKKVIDTIKFINFFDLYYRHSEIIVKYNICLKTFLPQGISEPVFYGDLVYKFKRIVGKPDDALIS